MRAKIYLIVFLVLISLAAAEVSITFDRDPVNYNRGNKKNVGITVNCAELSTVEIFNPNNQFLYIEGGDAQWATTYNTLSDPADGKYQVTARCEDGTSATSYFCVKANGCADPLQTGSSPDVRGRRGGAARYSGDCTPAWKCDGWGYCNSELKQKRLCSDLNYCFPVREEVRPCDKCEESWVCSIWSQCQNGRQSRTCTDQHNCRTSLKKPEVQRSCQVPSSGQGSAPSFGQQSGFVPPSAQQPTPKRDTKTEKSKVMELFEEHKWPVIGGGSFLLIIVIALLIFLGTRSKKQTYNIDELQDWIKKEQAMGTSKEDIEHILKERTGWSDQEVQQAFGNGQA